MAVAAEHVAMVLEELAARVVRAEAGGAALYMSTMRGIRQTTDGYRILKTSLEVWRLIGLAILLMDMEGIREVGAIEWSRGMACKSTMLLYIGLSLIWDLASV